MEPAGIGALIGSSIVFIAVAVTCLYDKCKHKETPETRNPLLIKKKSFKVKNLFSHVEI